MKQHRQHPRSYSSTKSITIEASDDDSQDECTDIPQQEPDNAKTHEVYFTATEAGRGLIYSDQTGKFPWTSNQGYKYLAIFYIYDSNAVLSVQSKVGKKVNYFNHTERSTPISKHVGSNQNSTSWTTRHPLTLKISSHPNRPSTITPHLIFTAPTQQRKASRPTKSISKPG